MNKPLRYELADGSVMRGEAHDAPALELAYVHHTLDDGTIMTEMVYRTVEAAPAAPAEATAAEPGAPDTDAAS